jgi:hypothetical protein
MLKRIFIFSVLLQTQISMASSVKDVYWYNFSPQVISLAGNTIKQTSYMEVVCDTSFHGILELEAAFENRAKTYQRTIEIDETTPQSVIQGDLFSYFFEVPHFTLPPATLTLKDKSGNRVKTVECCYFKLEGFVKSEFPHEKLYVSIVPNGFNDPDLFQQVQPDGYYSLLLPARYYNSLDSCRFRCRQRALCRVDYVLSALPAQTGYGAFRTGVCRTKQSGTNRYRYAGNQVEQLRAATTLEMGTDSGQII